MNDLESFFAKVISEKGLVNRMFILYGQDIGLIYRNYKNDNQILL